MAREQGATDTEQVAADQGRWVLFSTILASSMAFIDSTALNVTLPALQEDLRASGADLLWILNAYLLMLASFTLVGGVLGDQLGRKRIFGIGIGVFLVASLACGLAPNAGLLIAARALQGLGGALMIPGSLAIIGAAFGPQQRGQAIGTWSAVTTLVTVIGPLLGGWLADLGWWRAVFLINLPLGIVALAVLILRVPESRDEQAPSQIDYVGAALVALGLAGITYGFVSAPDRGFRDPLVIAALALGIVALLLFVVVEARSSHPMLPLGVFRSRSFSGTNLLTLLLYGALSAASFFLGLNLVQAQGYSQFLAGMAFSPFALILALLSRWSGRLVDRFGPRLPLTLGPATAGLGMLLLALIGQTNGPGDYWWTFFPALLVFGLGMALTVAPLTATVMGALPSHYAGTASGVNNAVARTAGVLALAVIGAVALLSFGTRIEARSSEYALSPQAQNELAAEASRLGDARVPASVPAELQPAIDQALQLAFIDTYRLVLLICALLAAGSAVAAWVMLVPKAAAETGELQHSETS